MGDVKSLHELHDAYIWKVNAAVGQDRLDLAMELADKYTDEALELIAGTESAGCGRPECDICTGTPERTPAVTPAITPADTTASVAPPARRGWWRRGRARRHVT